MISKTRSQIDYLGNKGLKMITVIYPVLDESSSEILKISIRSLCKHLKEDFNIIIHGHKPSWYIGDHSPKGYNIHGRRNISPFGYLDEYDEFLLMNDDFIVLEDVDINGFQPKKVMVDDYYPGFSSPFKQWVINSCIHYKRLLGIEGDFTWESHVGRWYDKESLEFIRKQDNDSFLHDIALHMFKESQGRLGNCERILNPLSKFEIYGFEKYRFLHLHPALRSETNLLMIGKNFEKCKYEL